MALPLTARSSNELDPYAASSVYYSEAAHKAKNHHRARTYSTNHSPTFDRSQLKPPRRRGSHDDYTLLPQKFNVHVEKTIKMLQEQEDTDGNFQITIEDNGPKVFSLGTAASNGYRKKEVRGNYIISNLLQELYLAKENNLSQITLDEARINENPVNRLSRLIKDEFWGNLTRVIDGSVIEIAGKDPKDWTDDPRPRIYVPHGAPEQYEYYCKVARDRPEIRLDVCLLPKKITPEYVRDLNSKPGLLAVAMEEAIDPKTGKKTLKGVPFVVPGGRFNELYGWDSYMESLGLMATGKIHLAKAMVTNFCFCIEHYGKILNATRSYYLSRSQPPFLTDMALRIYEGIKTEEGAKDFLRRAILAAIKEYHTVWMAQPRYDPITGLSRYRPEGLGVPPETESTHFTHILEPYAKKHGITFTEFVAAYNKGEVKEPELDEYFLHDRAVRESGHDTSYRLEKVCANLATIDLNSLLYKYEKDIEKAIKEVFNNSLEVPEEFLCAGMKPGHRETSAIWDRRSKERRSRVNHYLWNQKEGMYFDYDTVKQKQCTYQSATTFWAMWSGLATPQQAARLVETALPLFEVQGGLVSGTEKSRGAVGLDRPNRQWDYPYGWAPQQMLAWTGLEKYHYHEEAQRLAYKWLYMMTKAFVDFNGVVVEKYDVTRLVDPHRVDAEYGNQGLDFKGVAKEGFGWVNASYVYGLQICNIHMRRALGTLTPWAQYDKSLQTINDITTPPPEDDAIRSEGTGKASNNDPFTE